MTDTRVRRVLTTPRIGITKAAALPLRYVIAANEFVSGAKTADSLESSEQTTSSKRILEVSLKPLRRSGSAGEGRRTHASNGIKQDVVDQASASYEGRNGNQRRAREFSYWIERRGIHDLEIVQMHRGFLRQHLFPRFNQVGAFRSP